MPEGLTRDQITLIGRAVEAYHTERLEQLHVGSVDVGSTSYRQHLTNLKGRIAVKAQSKYETFKRDNPDESKDPMLALRRARDFVNESMNEELTRYWADKGISDPWLAEHSKGYLGDMDVFFTHGAHDANTGSLTFTQNIQPPTGLPINMMADYDTYSRAVFRGYTNRRIRESLHGAGLEVPEDFDLNTFYEAVLRRQSQGQTPGTQAAEGIVARGRARAAASSPAQTAPATQVVKASLGGRFWAYDNEAVDVALNPVEGLLTAEQITALNGVKRRKLTGNYYFSEPVDTALAEAFYRAYEIGGQRTAERNPQRRGSGWVAASGATVATVGTVTAFKDGIFYAPVVAAKYAIPGAAGTWLPFVDLLWGVPIATASVVVGSAAYAKRKQIATYVNQHMVEPIRARYRAWGAPPAAAPAPTPAPVPAPPVAPLPGATAPVAPPIPAVVAIPVGAAAPPVVPAPVAPPAVPAPVAPPAAAPAPAPAPAPVAAPVAPVAPVVPLPAAAPPVAPAPSPLAAALAAAPPIVLPPAP